MYYCFDQFDISDILEVKQDTEKNKAHMDGVQGKYFI